MTSRLPALALSLALTATTLAAARAAQNELGFNERFALADNRAAALAELIPGTPDTFYYQGLHLQNTGRLAEVTPLLQQWLKRHGRSPRYDELENRQMLLTYADNPQRTLDFLRNRLGLSFSHQREQERAATYPTALAPARVAYDRFRQQALDRHNDLGGFEDDGLEAMAGAPLSPEERRDLLQRLPRPDVTGLVEVVLTDLRDPQSGGFGSRPVHARLTLAQLESVRVALPSVAASQAYVDAILARLAPDADRDWRADPALRGAYLERLWTFVAGLPPAHDSLKACVLYRLLQHDRTQGRYDRDRFRAYLQLPRPGFFVRREWLAQTAPRGPAINLNADYRAGTGLEPVGNDEPLVRDYLAQFLREADDWKAFAEWFEEDYLKQAFAETKILNGVGDLERWYALMPPDRHQALKERIDLELLPQNPEQSAADAPVELQVAVKNVTRLTVKVYDLDAAACYRESGEEVTTAVDLDGIQPNVERTVEYTQPPLRRHVEKLAFPELKAPGLYVVELVGNGVSSRALVRKGRLRFVERTGSAGHVFTVFDDGGAVVQGAALWVAGQSYKADDDGTINVPFSTKTGAGSVDQMIVVQAGRLACLGRFRHAPESYELRLGHILDREDLAAGHQATLILRPLLLANDRPADLELLHEVALEVRTTDVEGLDAVQRSEGLGAPDGQDWVHRFRVPPRTVRVAFRLTAKVRNLSQNREDEVAADGAVELNGILSTDQVADLFLRRVDAGYVVEARGRSGEPLADRPLSFSFRHRLFRDEVTETLQTDANGRTVLGRLDDIVTVAADGAGAARRWWPARLSGASVPPQLHAAQGDSVVLPAESIDPARLREGVSLLALAPGGQNVADLGECARVVEGRLELAGLPAGDHRLTLKKTKQVVDLRIARAVKTGATLVGPVRGLERTPTRPLRVAEVAVTGEALRVRLANASPAARVHVIARRTTLGGGPWLDYAGGLARRPADQARWLPLPTLYISGRSVGDEARYVLERRYAPRLPGNMLERPSLLLNPWSATAAEESQRQLAQTGEAWGAATAPMSEMLADRAKGMRSESLRAYGGSAAQRLSLGGLDFLPEPARVWANLKPAADGTVAIPLADLGGRSEVVAVAADELGYAWRVVALPEPAWQPRDLRLAKAFDPARPMAERKQVTPVTAGQPFTAEDIATTKAVSYATLGDVFRLFQSLAPNPDLERFAFVLQWPELKPERQRELYSEFACHELNLFLYHKDRAFFDKVIQPYVEQKRDKQFIDLWLLGRDLSAWLAPAEYARLNTFERILLGQRVKTAAATVPRQVEDQDNLRPPDPDGFDRRFRTALQSGELEGASPADKARELAEGERERAAKPQAPPPPAGGAMPVTTVTAAPAAFDGKVAARKLMARQDLAKDIPAEEGLAEAAEMLMEDKSDVAGDLGLIAGESLKRKADNRRRQAVRMLYRSPETTREWIENHYWHVPLAAQAPALIPVNGFWSDYARHAAAGPFLSPHVDEAAGSLAERLCALAVLDLPFKAAAPKDELQGTRWTLTHAGAALVFNQQIGPAEPAGDAGALMVVENVWDLQDPVRRVGNEQVEKYVREEFVAGRVYGARVVLTNPTAARRKVSVLLQAPEGSVAVRSGQATRSVPLDVDPYSTRTLEYFFYFPQPGEFRHYPVSVAEGARVAGRAEPLPFHVVARPSKTDTASWAYVSQNGTLEDVVAFLGRENIFASDIDLGRIAWRLRERPAFERVLAALDARHACHDGLWSYAIQHNAAPRIREYLRRQPFAGQVGAWLRSPLLDVDAEWLRTYEHKEFWPLVNARAHALGKARTIANTALYRQYNALLDGLAYKPALDARDRLAVVAYLLQQDRVAEAARWLGTVKPADAETRLQADYARAYLAFSRGEPQAAQALAKPYANHPVDRWRQRFLNVLAQADEAAGAAAQVANRDQREQVQDELAAAAPTLALRIEGTRLDVRSRNVAHAELRFYPLDLELLFSRSPFLADAGARFGHVRPALVLPVPLGPGEIARAVDVPREWRERNAAVEVAAEGLVEHATYTPHALDAQVVANYGQLRVRRTDGGKPLAGAYVKVYARFQGGEERFYKDGYTDLRGAFDYASLSTDDLNRVEQFALLVLDDKLGAVVLTAPPPKR